MKPLIILVLTLIALFVAGASMPNLADKYAPFEVRWNECLICGRSQTVENRWRRTPVTKVEEYDHSRWADTLSPRHKHHWATSSVESREEWFGSSMVGCGGIGGIGSLYYIHSHQGDDVAAPLVEKYLKLAKTGDLTAISDFTRGELSKAVETAVAARNNGQ
jgi:hypothetical protein